MMADNTNPKGGHQLAILGTRGIPARHGGFETFAERLAVHLVGCGWDVEVYCQDDAKAGAPAGMQDRPRTWRGVRLRHINVSLDGSAGSILFDWRALRQASRDPRRVLLTLGYNTAIFGALALSRMRERRQLVNMDGIEWRRAKWSRPVRAWFWLNERVACWTADHLIADNPHIADHLATRVARQHITTIPYGADRIDPATVDTARLVRLGLAPDSFALAIARPEPENSLLEIVRAFSRRLRGMRLVVLGHYDPQHPYHRAVRAAASEEVVFPGAIYDPETVGALRHHGRVYLHGHRVGGTNPSLVEALAAGSPVLAHDNPFNRWVAGPGAAFFADESGCEAAIAALLDDVARLAAMRKASLARHAEAFTWPDVLAQYRGAPGSVVAVRSARRRRDEMPRTGDRRCRLRRLRSPARRRSGPRPGLRCRRCSRSQW